MYISVVLKDSEPDLSSEIIQAARERLHNPPGKQVYMTEFIGLPVALSVTSAVHDTTMGDGNPYGITLGGFRIVDTSDLEKVGVEPGDYAGFLAADMTRKWITLYTLLKGLHKEALASDYEVKSAKMGGGKDLGLVTDIDTFRKLKANGDFRRDFFHQHGQHIDSLGGLRITAVDMGTNSSDMDIVLDTTSYVTCQSESRGGTGNPSGVTATGVWTAAKTLLEFYGVHPSECTYVVQGVGSVGSYQVGLMRRDLPDAKIYVCDKNPKAIEGVTKYGVEMVEPDNFHRLDADVLMPTANPGILTYELLEEMHPRVKFIVGAANDPYPTANGMPDPKVVRAYHSVGKIVAPAPLVNLGGILDVSRGFWKYWGGPEATAENKSRSFELVEGVSGLIKSVALDARVRDIPLEEAYDEMVVSTYAQYCLENGVDLL